MSNGMNRVLLIFHVCSSRRGAEVGYLFSTEMRHTLEDVRIIRFNSHNYYRSRLCYLVTSSSENYRERHKSQSTI